MEKKGVRGFFSARNVAYLSVLLALVIVLQAFGGTISIGAVQLNFTLIPIAVGAILFGPWVGAILGFACGIVVLVQVIMGLGAFYVVIWTYSPVVTTLTCIVKTTAAGLLAGLLYRILASKNRLIAVFVAAGIVPIVNTALFILGCLCMGNAISAFQGEIELSGMNIFVFILVVLVTFNFFIEFGINIVLAPAIHRVVVVVEKSFAARKKPHAVADEPADVPQTDDTQTGGSQTEKKS